MTDCQIIKLAERCVAGECVDCPYTDNDCSEVLERLLELAKRQKTLLEQPVIAGEECAAMPNYEEMYNRLEKEVGVITHERNLAYAERDQAQQKLYYLRAVKATAEAFLGRKIEG